MPRKARIDAPGALHHVIARGIEKRDIFWDDHDRNDFLERLGTIIDESGTCCYAWRCFPIIVTYFSKQALLQLPR
jgi:hypothetical protein